MPGNGTIDQAAVELYKQKAKPVTIEVVVVKDLAAAMDYAIEVADKALPAKFMPTTKDRVLPDSTDRKKVLAAPGLGEGDWEALSRKGEAKGFQMLRSGLRSHLAGFEVAFTVADMAIAETASALVENDSEDLRLSTMVCETHVMALPMRKIVKTSMEALPYLTEAFGRDHNYTSFISGPSRTADIERVLALGVHGPLYLHVALMEE
jgi:L-lactate dehydrogenase complex protein LldG